MGTQVPSPGPTFRGMSTDTYCIIHRAYNLWRRRQFVRSQGYLLLQNQVAFQINHHIYCNVPDQEDREDDEDDEEDTQNVLVKKVSSTEQGAYEQDVRDSLTGPINLQDLRISLIPKPDELQDSLSFFESLLKENYGEAKFKRAIQIIEDFPGDIYLEQNERKLLAKLRELFGGVESAAQGFLHECSSYLLMKQNSAVAMVSV